MYIQLTETALQLMHAAFFSLQSLSRPVCTLRRVLQFVSVLLLIINAFSQAGTGSDLAVESSTALQSDGG